MKGDHLLHNAKKRGREPSEVREPAPIINQGVLQQDKYIALTQQIPGLPPSPAMKKIKTQSSAPAVQKAVHTGYPERFTSLSTGLDAPPKTGIDRESSKLGAGRPMNAGMRRVAGQAPFAAYPPASSESDDGAPSNNGTVILHPNPRHSPQSGELSTAAGERFQRLPPPPRSPAVKRLKGLFDPLRPNEGTQLDGNEVDEDAVRAHREAREETDWKEVAGPKQPKATPEHQHMHQQHLKSKNPELEPPQVEDENSMFLRELSDSEDVVARYEKEFGATMTSDLWHHIRDFDREPWLREKIQAIQGVLEKQSGADVSYLGSVVGRAKLSEKLRELNEAKDQICSKSEVLRYHYRQGREYYLMLKEKREEIYGELEKEYPELGIVPEMSAPQAIAPSSQPPQSQPPPTNPATATSVPQASQTMEIPAGFEFRFSSGVLVVNDPDRGTLRVPCKSTQKTFSFE